VHVPPSSQPEESEIDSVYIPSLSCPSSHPALRTTSESDKSAKLDSGIDTCTQFTHIAVFSDLI
jgi:hypothetical protein